MFAQKPDLKLVCAKDFTDNKVIGIVIEYGSPVGQRAASRMITWRAFSNRDN